MFKTLREKAGFTTEYVARKLEISLSTLYKYEQSQLLPSAKILLKMQGLYKCSPEKIFKAYEKAKEEKYEREVIKGNRRTNR